MSDLRSKLTELLADFQPFHSEFQMDAFITVQAGYNNPYGMYRQALRELSSRHATLRKVFFTRRKLAVDLREKRVTASGKAIEPYSPPDEFEKIRAEISVDEILDEMAAIERRLKDQEREFRHFFAQALHFKSLVGELTPERRIELDEEFWYERLRTRLAIEILRDGRPSVDLIHTFGHLKPSMRDRLGPEIQNPEAAVTWFQTRPAVEIPPLPEEYANINLLQGEELLELVA